MTTFCLTEVTLKFPPCKPVMSDPKFKLYETYDPGLRHFNNRRKTHEIILLDILLDIVLLCFLRPPSLTTPSLSCPSTIPATASDNSLRPRPRDLHVPADRMVSELYVASASGDLDKVSALLEGGDVDLEIKGVYRI